MRLAIFATRAAESCATQESGALVASPPVHPSAGSELRAGDLITVVNGELIEHTTDVVRMLRAREGNTMLIVVRDGSAMNIATVGRFDDGLFLAPPTTRMPSNLTTWQTPVGFLFHL